jgi:hypothetical protein
MRAVVAYNAARRQLAAEVEPTGERDRGNAQC